MAQPHNRKFSAVA